MPNGAVSQKWLLGILTTIILALAGGWMGYVHSQIATVVADQKKQRESDADTKRDTAVIREKVERTEQDVKEIKQDQREQGKKLDELLRRVK